MKLLFDLSATQADNGIINHGGSEYAKAVFIKLIEFCPESVSVFYNRNLALGKSLSEIIQEHSLITLDNIDITSICSFVREKNINVFYTALPRSEYSQLIEMQSESFKVIITIHGLRSLELPSDSYEWYYCRSAKSKIKFIYKRLFPSHYRNSTIGYYKKLLGVSKIVTVSNHSKNSLLSFFPEISPEKVIVLYSPLIDYKKENNIDSIVNLSLTPRKYFLLLSGSIWTKNSIRAIKAFDEFISSNPENKDLKMIITGVSKPIYRTKNQENFVFTGYLNRDTLEELYRNALALVYPTLNEGFGYPPLEALKYGVPVLASGIGPIPEVCDNAANYFNPANVDEIKSLLSSTILNSDLFSDENIQIRINRYTLIKERQEYDLNKMIKILYGETYSE